MCFINSYFIRVTYMAQRDDDVARRIHNVINRIVSLADMMALKMVIRAL
jgi:hypothetical protein